VPFRDAASARHYLREPSHAFAESGFLYSFGMTINERQLAFLFQTAIASSWNENPFLGNDNSLARNGRDGRDLRNRTGALPHCWGWGRLLESEQGLLRLIPHA